MDSSDEELSFFCLMLEDEVIEHRQEVREKRKRKIWIHLICSKRKVFGEYHHLFPDLLADKDKFWGYFRITPDRYFQLLEIIKGDLHIKTTTFREPIGPEERLVVCLR